jgi:hypothetical protein
MRIFLSLCVLLAGCSLGDAGPTGSGNSQAGDDDSTPTAAELAEQAELVQVSEIAQRNDQEVERLIKEGQAAGVEKEIRAAVGRLIIAGNARIVEDGQLSGAKWVEQQVSGKTHAEIIAAFPEQP